MTLIESVGIRLAKMLLLVIMAISSLSSCSDMETKEESNNNQKEIKKASMKKVLIIGIDPSTIDFTNPELPKGLNREMVEQGTRATLEKLNSMGYKAEAFLIETGRTDLSDLEEQLKTQKYDGIVVGNGIRSQSANFILFEQIINVIHAHATGSKIIFNTLPTNTDEAVKRWL